MRSLLIALSSLLLTACWEGENLYSDTDAKPALEPGLYRIVVADEPPTEARVSTSASGLTQFERTGEKVFYGLVPLDPKLGRFVAWYGGDGQSASGKGSQAYALVLRQADGSYIAYPPSCSGEEGEVARNTGAVIEAGMIATCRFPNRDSLERAMGHLRTRDLGASMRLIRIED